MEELARPVEDAFSDEGITLKYLAKKIKRELNAKKTVYVKVRGAIDEQQAKKERVVKIAETDEETVLAATAIDWGTRQRARQDAQKLLGHYPAEKHELKGEGSALLVMNLGGPADGGAAGGEKAAHGEKDRDSL
jgi:hypothetical protein